MCVYVCIYIYIEREREREKEREKERERERERYTMHNYLTASSRRDTFIKNSSIEMFNCFKYIFQVLYILPYLVILFVMKKCF